MIISIKIPYLEKKEKIMLKTFLSLKNIQVSGANSNTIEMVKMQIIDQFENGEKKTWCIFQFWNRNSRSVL